MGKIRVKTFGIEEEEKKQAQKAKNRREGKKRLKNGQVVSKAPGIEEPEKIEVAKVENEKEKKVSRPGTDQPLAKKTRQHSKQYKVALSQVDKNKLYSLPDAISLLKTISKASFNPTVELHLNTVQKGISGRVDLPHGTGKTVRVTIADPTTDGQFDTLLKNIESGKIDFDVLIATPTAMQKLAKVAKILGPKGLMPNPKNGTISETPEKLAEKYKGGQVNFRTETQAPLMHTIVGKLSFSKKDLEENIIAFLKAVGSTNITNVTLKSTMSPGIHLDLANITF